MFTDVLSLSLFFLLKLESVHVHRLQKMTRPQRSLRRQAALFARAAKEMVSLLLFKLDKERISSSPLNVLDVLVRIHCEIPKGHIAHCLNVEMRKLEWKLVPNSRDHPITS